MHVRLSPAHIMRVSTLLLISSIALAEPTQPTSQPTTQPDKQKLGEQIERLQQRVEKMQSDPENQLDRAKKKNSPAPDPKTAPLASAAPATSPATNPSTNPTAQVKFPTPAELYEKMQKAKAEKAAQLKIAYFDLSDPITEKPSDFSIFNPEGGLTLQKLIDRINKARDDKDVRAVLVTLGDASMGLAQAAEVRDALKDVARSNKRVFVYADSYDTVAYTIASGATDICLLQGGEIMIPGVGFETMFYKGTMDKLGVKADYIQIGEYKGAEEPYTRTEPSEELRGELTKLTDAIYNQLVDGISMARGVSRQTVQQLIDDTMLSAAGAKDRGFVDHIVDQDGLRGLIKDELGGDIDLLADYGATKREEIDWSNPLLVLASLAKRPEPSNKPAIALIYADGVIVDGDGEGGLLSGGGNVGSDPMRRAFRTALRDDNIKAIVLRIDSPGGSALASEVMWQAARRAATKKPLIVSVGGMAASGGYYLASAGDYIFADPSGIVGSIGVVGGKFVTKDLFDKVGLNTETFSKGRNAGLFSSNEPWSDRQRRMVRAWMQQTYDQFTQRIMTTRSAKIADIDKVARGRIFLARQAKELGMVDELGGTQAAIDYAAKKVNLDPGSYEVRTVPGPRTFADFFGGGSQSDTTFPFKPRVQVNVGAESLLNALAPELRVTLMQQLQFLQLLQQRPVVLMVPYAIRTR